jgi:hypothetical protein
MNLDSSVNTVPGYGLNDRGSILGRNRDLCLHHRVQTGSRAHEAYRMHTEGSLPWVSWPELEADRSLPSSSEVVEFYLYSFIGLHGMVVKHRKNFHCYNINNNNNRKYYVNNTPYLG